MKVVEIFGPTIQGEGPHAGRPTHFLRFGGCDYDCSWCDSPHAVKPELVREAPSLSDTEILRELDALAPAPMVVISGGNPALQKLDALMPALRARYTVAVETQGSVYRAWLADADSLVVSPKPPSSGEATRRNWAAFVRFMDRAPWHDLTLKIVIFDAEDLAWARNVHETFPDVPLHLSVGTEPGTEDPLTDVAGRYRWLAEAVTAEPALHDTVVLPQLHVIAWGHAVGV